MRGGGTPDRRTRGRTQLPRAATGVRVSVCVFVCVCARVRVCVRGDGTRRRGVDDQAGSATCRTAAIAQHLAVDVCVWGRTETDTVTSAQQLAGGDRE